MDTRLQLGLVVWALKPLADGLPGLGLKTRETLRGYMVNFKFLVHRRVYLIGMDSRAAWSLSLPNWNDVRRT